LRQIRVKFVPNLSQIHHRENAVATEAPLFAVIDLGSNSFRLELSTLQKGKFKRLAYHKETVRLGGGLDAKKNLTPAAIEGGLACLRRFSAVLTQTQPTQVCAIATQTLREARNAASFQEKAEAILGYPLHIISGREEARLIYQGVVTRLPESEEKRLVIDIGGRSTEIISGQGLRPHVAESFPIGSVSLSQQFFASGALSAAAFDAAVAGTADTFGKLSVLYPHSDWDCVYGSAGTTSAVADILQGAGFAANHIDRSGLHWLRGQLIAAGNSSKLDMPGLKEDRKPVIGGGLSTLLGLFDALEIQDLQIVSGALRHGVLQGLLKQAEKITSTPA
jgi:exopolyphosphatase/guanosine-5'-triphosphate,3'-diphosphate pyrophosphatase